MIARERGSCRAPADIEANIRRYLGDRTPSGRYASYDYCFNYFQSYRERGVLAALASDGNRQLSCLQLGFYLASWGMLRGSTDLLKRSVKHLVPLVEAIAAAPPEMWTIDAHSYGEEQWTTLHNFAGQVRTSLADRASDTLVTKIILGVFGSIPAFDTSFKKGSGLSTYGHGALGRIERFYRENAGVIDRYRVPTLDFDTGALAPRAYTRAKVIDMVFFIEGSGSPPSPHA